MKKESTIFWFLSSCFVFICIGVILYSRFSAEKETITVRHIDDLQITASDYLSEAVSQYETKQNTEKININTASKEQLVTLPGIGEKTAESIVAYREEYGFFDHIDEITEVNGIGQAKFDAIKAYITV